MNIGVDDPYINFEKSDSYFELISTNQFRLKSLIFIAKEII